MRHTAAFVMDRGMDALVLAVIAGVIVVVLMVRAWRRAGRVIDNMPLPTNDRPLVEEGGPAHQLHAWARRGDSGRVRDLLQSGVDCDSPGPEGVTALMLAAAYGHHEVVEVLLAHGADVNKLDGAGCSALVDAVLNGHESVVQLLTNSGADPDAGVLSAREAAKSMGRVDLLTEVRRRGSKLPGEVIHPTGRDVDEKRSWLS